MNARLVFGKGFNRRIGAGLIATAAAASCLVAGLAASPADSDAARKAKKPSSVVKVMTRNVYLGADLTGAIQAPNSSAFFAANGQIVRDVDTNDFPTRAKGLAAEINGKSPDLVGLQEVARWATGPANLAVISDPSQSTATNVKYDFLGLLMAELNRGKKRYRVVRVTQEFDFEAPANYLESYPDINGRLTMRDVILARVDSRIRTRNVRGGNYETLYQPVVSGIAVTVQRGWNSVEARIGKGPWFKFVNTHLEAFGDDKNKVVDCMTDPDPAYAGNPVSIRCRQAAELFRKAIAPGKIPVIAVGDFNSDDKTVVNGSCPSASNLDGTLTGNNGGICGDTLAYNALKQLGMRSIEPKDLPSCCVDDSILTADRGSRSDFDHHIDHILTDSPRRVKRISTAVTGLEPVNGFWDSDHAGVFGKLRVHG